MAGRRFPDDVIRVQFERRLYFADRFAVKVCSDGGKVSSYQVFSPVTSP